jgi:prepilin peptidase CpaA
MIDKLALPSALLLAALSAIVVIAAWTDVRERRIPNWLCAVNLGLGLGFSGLAAGWPGTGSAFAHVAAALAVTMGLFAAGAIGAGDAKFYASMAAWLPIGDGLLLLSLVALAGLALLVLFVAIRLRGRSRRPRDSGSPFSKLPYGVAIGLGGLAAVALA